MISFFDTPYNSIVIIGSAIAYGTVAPVTTLGIRVIQAIKSGLPADEPMLPRAGVLHWLEWSIFTAMFL
jgi:hypothetical protein